MKRKSNIYLIGYRCTGKSVVGRALAETLGRPFLDADDELVRAHGMTIQHIVRAQGWDGFREKESRVLERIRRLDGHVVATGGGVILSPDNVEKMRHSGVVVWLRATPATIRQRLETDVRTDPLRPSLTSKGVVDEVEDVLKKREPLYRMAAHHTLDTDESSVDAISKKILAMVSGEGN